MRPLPHQEQRERERLFLEALLFRRKGLMLAVPMPMLSMSMCTLFSVLAVLTFCMVAVLLVVLFVVLLVPVLWVVPMDMNNLSLATNLGNLCWQPIWMFLYSF